MFNKEHHRLLIIIFPFDQVKHCDVNEIFELAFFLKIFTSRFTSTVDYRKNNSVLRFNTALSCLRIKLIEKGPEKLYPWSNP